MDPLLSLREMIFLVGKFACMEAYLEALDVGVLIAASQGFPKRKDPTNLQGNEVNYEKWNAKARNTSLDAFTRMFLTMCRTTKTPMHYGRTFVRSMREPRVSMRNAIILWWKSLIHLRCFLEKVPMRYIHTNATLWCCEKDLECPPHWQIWAYCDGASSRWSFHRYTNSNIGEDQCTWDVHAHHSIRWLFFHQEERFGIQG